MWCLALCFSLSILNPDDLYKALVHGHVTETTQAFFQAGVPIWPLLVFDVFSSVTLVLSALAHTFACLPKPVSSVFWKLDQLGIALGVQLRPSAGVLRPGTLPLCIGPRVVVRPRCVCQIESHDSRNTER